MRKHAIFWVTISDAMLHQSQLLRRVERLDVDFTPITPKRPRINSRAMVLLT
jgi:hypothetical protein